MLRLLVLGSILEPAVGQRGARSDPPLDRMQVSSGTSLLTETLSARCQALSIGYNVLFFLCEFVHSLFAPGKYGSEVACMSRVHPVEAQINKLRSSQRLEVLSRRPDGNALYLRMISGSLEGFTSVLHFEHFAL